MMVHHLNCGTLAPPGGGLLMSGGARMACHCLLVETTRDGLVLVDAGLGDLDMADPAGRLGSWFKHIANPVGDPTETAASQVARLGHAPADVRHVVMTHLDLDHAGGLCDFPGARVHVMQAELSAATRPKTSTEARRYRQAHWSHEVAWQTYPSEGGVEWQGISGARQLEGVDAGLLLVPLAGHTRGHAGVAVARGEGWLLHAGDAVLSIEELSGKPMPRLALYHRVGDEDPAQGRRTRQALTNLAKKGGVRITASHDLRDCDKLARGASVGGDT